MQSAVIIKQTVFKNVLENILEVDDVSAAFFKIIS